MSIPAELCRSLFPLRQPLPAKNVRGARGSMLGLTMLIGGILIFIFMVGFCLYFLLAQHKSGQARTEFSVLYAAKVLNENDRVGQINNVVARSRELVYLSRLSEAQASRKELREWEPLARYLCDEAREGSKLVEAERKNQIRISKNILGSLAYQYNERAKKKPDFSLPFWQSSATQVDDAILGSVKNVESNVLNSDVYPELRDFDEQKHYFQKGSSLYLGNINAKLSSPDDDLDFKLASLPAPVENTVAPARLIQANVFKPSAAVYVAQKFKDNPVDQIPTALEVTQHMTVKLQSSDMQDVQLKAWAAAPGAMPPPP